MDQRQRDLLASSAPQLADVINFVELAELLQLAKLVSSSKVEEIMVSSMPYQDLFDWPRGHRSKRV